jgi:probable rRNA maturation factor
MSSLRISINNRYPALRRPALATRRMLRQLERCGRFPIAEGDLSIVFVDDAAIAKVHADFMDDPTPTDVITFPADPELDFAGEIIVSVDHALAHAKENQLPFNQELALYLIHGWLHLAGYDDRNPDDRKAMRQAETLALECVANVIPDYRLR